MSLPEWSYLHGKPQQSARFKLQPEDFVVIEDMGFEPDGAGEHILVYNPTQVFEERMTLHELMR